MVFFPQCPTNFYPLTLIEDWACIVAMASWQIPKIQKCWRARMSVIRFVYVVFSLSLGNLHRRCQTASPPQHFTSHELVTIIQRHLFHSTFSLFLLSIYIYIYIFFFFLGFVVRYWMMMTWCFGATSLLTWPLSVKHQTCAKLSDVHSTYRLSSLFSNHIMASSMIIFFFYEQKNIAPNFLISTLPQ